MFRVLKRAGNSKFLLAVLMPLFLFLILWRPVLAGVGGFLIEDDGGRGIADAVVLAGDFPVRTREAAMQYREGKIRRVYFTADAKDESVSDLESMGIAFESTWDKNRRVMAGLGVPESAVLSIPGEVRATRDEADRIRAYAKDHGITSLRVITSKYHSRRACWALRRMVPSVQFSCSPSRYDRYNPEAWWKNRRDIMNVFSEYLKFIGYFIELATDRRVDS